MVAKQRTQRAVTGGTRSSLAGAVLPGQFLADFYIDFSAGWL